jgi:hypothetical protein
MKRYVLKKTVVNKDINVNNVMYKNDFVTTSNINDPMLIKYAFSSRNEAHAYMLKALEYENQVKSDLQVNYEVIEVNC